MGQNRRRKETMGPFSRASVAKNACSLRIGPLISRHDHQLWRRLAFFALAPTAIAALRFSLDLSTPPALLFSPNPSIFLSHILFLSLFFSPICFPIGPRLVVSNYNICKIFQKLQPRVSIRWIKSMQSSRSGYAWPFTKHQQVQMEISWTKILKNHLVLHSHISNSHRETSSASIKQNFNEKH